MHKGYQKILSFMQGAAWGAVVVGAYLFFTLFLPLGFLTAILGAFFGASIGLMLVFFFESAHLKLQIYRESKAQTKLLKKLLHEMEKPSALEREPDASLSDH